MGRLHPWIEASHIAFVAAFATEGLLLILTSRRVGAVHYPGFDADGSGTRLATLGGISIVVAMGLAVSVALSGILDRFSVDNLLWRAAILLLPAYFVVSGVMVGLVSLVLNRLGMR